MPDLSDIQAEEQHLLSGSRSLREAASRDLWVRRSIDYLAGDESDPAAGVVRPNSTEDVARWMRIAGRAGRTVTALGAGSGVCGGIEPGAQGIVLDTKGLRLLQVEPAEGVVHCGAGVIGQHAEDACNQRGYTIGHFPSSIACSTVGG